MNAQQFLHEAVASQKCGPIPEAVLKMLAQTVNETAEINKKPRQYHSSVSLRFKYHFNFKTGIWNDHPSIRPPTCNIY